jgi:phosphoribosyl-ATP pyrophosphohydrolase/phosphoribosyl-AMP cyclohydrolase/histidinol dehydrogenase
MTRLRRIDPEVAVQRTLDAVPAEVVTRAATIVDRVRTGGSEALRQYASELDGLAENQPLVLDRGAMEQALASLSREDRELLERTAERIRKFAQAQRTALSDLRLVSGGIEMGHRISAVPAAGCYAPGGRYPLPSSVMMTAVTARVAGVETVVVASPSPDPVTVAAAAVSDADLFLTAGGAHAIAAMAFGNGEIPACDVIVGPGNSWVTAAKELVAGRVRIDSLAGPSELLVVTDCESDPALAAADLLAQAEHDPAAVPLLVTTDEEFITRVEVELDRQLSDLPTADIARQAIENGGVMLAADLAEAVRICNRIGPEHLQWMATDSGPTEGLEHFGGLFIGPGAAEVLGDYGAGPNHVLPTGGQARARGGLSVFDFLKITTWMRAADPDPAVAIDAAALARLEGLEGHARAAEKRVQTPFGRS